MIVFNQRRIKHMVASLMTAAMLFSQGLAVVQACTELDARPAMAFEQADCHAPQNPNHCLQQCTASDQSSAFVQIALAAAPADAILRLPAREERPLSACAHATDLLAAADPPPSILFCSFQL